MDLQHFQTVFCCPFPIKGWETAIFPVHRKHGVSKMYPFPRRFWPWRQIPRKGESAENKQAKCWLIGKQKFRIFSKHAHVFLFQNSASLREETLAVFFLRLTNGSHSLSNSRALLPNCRLIPLATIGNYLIAKSREKVGDKNWECIKTPCEN